MKKIQSTCNYCAIDCNLDFYVEDNRVIKTVPTKGYPVNDGFCCIKVGILLFFLSMYTFLPLFAKRFRGKAFFFDEKV